MRRTSLRGRRRRPSSAVLAALVVLVVGPGTPRCEAQARRLGHLSFPNSGRADAQAPFVEGVLLLHSFEFEDAAAAFRRAQAVDREFALAYWGEAMTYNHPLWRQQDRGAALQALARFAPTPEAREARAPTPREAAYLAAVDVLYGDGPKAERDARYAEAMRKLSATWPRDLEARAFHALAILGTTDGVRDFATYMRAAAVAQMVFAANPRHPGAAHYIIHSFDDPVHAPLGLTAARAYASIAPDAGHAQHMTSHIFVALGMWDDVVTANIRARDVQNAGLARKGRLPNVCGHYTSWLHYGWLQQGDVGAAEKGMAACLDRVRGGATPGEQAYFVNMRARHVLDTRDWGAAARLSVDGGLTPHARRHYRFIDGYAAAMTGDTVAARAALQDLRRLNGEIAEPDERARIAGMELEALLDIRNGRAEQGVARLRNAAAVEESLPFEFGPPASLKPPHELLGEVLLDLGRPEEAAEAFRAALRLTPGRTLARRGLEMATSSSGSS